MDRAKRPSLLAKLIRFLQFGARNRHGKVWIKVSYNKIDISNAG